MKRTEPSTKIPPTKTGFFATLRALFHANGTIAPSVRLVRLTIFSAVLFSFALALIAASASAAPPNFCPPGSAAGQCNLPNSVAVDQSTAEPTSGHVYIGEDNNKRIDEFAADGTFIRAFGFGVRDGANELQTCTTVCIEGREGSAPGTIRPSAIVAASGAVYAADPGHGRVEKYKLNPLTEEYELLFIFGSSGTGAGQFSGVRLPLALDSSGDVWVGDQNRLEQFSPAGAFLSEVALPGTGEISSLAIDTDSLSPSFEDFYVKSSSVTGVQKLKANGELIETLDASGHPNALALDPASGSLFISDQLEPQFTTNYGKATLLEFDSSGAQIEAFGSGEVIGGPVGNALAFGDTAQRLYVASSTASTGGAPGQQSAAQAFALPEPGPLPGFGTTLAKGIKKTAASLCAKVNPEGKSTTVHFQYITAAKFKEDGEEFGAGAEETSESASIGSDFELHEACQAISSLAPVTSYRIRVVATNVNGVIDGETASFETLPPAAIDSTSAAEVTATSATLEAEINPLGDATTYRFEYLTEAEYEENLEAGPDGFSGGHPATLIPVPDAPLGAGSADVPVSQHLQGLSPHTAYRYRVVIRNAVSEANDGPFAGPTLTFTTQFPAAPGLPDARAWELVSPPDKRGADLKPVQEGPPIQAAASGGAIAYLATAPTEAQPPGFAGGVGRIQVLSTRGPGGWASRDLAAPHSAMTGATVGLGGEFPFFSADLSLSLLDPVGPFEPSISPAASAQTPFLRADFPPADATAFCTVSCYRPLVTGCPEEGEPCPAAVEAAADVPPGTEFTAPGFSGASPDLSHVILRSGVALTPIPAPQGGLYEWSAPAPPAAALRLISVLPDGEPVEGVAFLGFQDSIARNAISPDGSRVVFESGGGSRHLYLRYNATQEQSQIASGQCTEPAKACTVQLDALQGGPGGSQAPAPHFQTASSDASRVFFTDSQQLTPDSGTSPAGGDLYEYDLAAPAAERLTDLSPASAGEPAAVLGLLPGASQDGSSLYFVADGVLTGEEENAQGETAQPGGCIDGNSLPSASDTCNLYRRQDGTTSLIAVLSAADQPDWSGRSFGASLSGLTSRVSPDGRWFAFMSQRSLTGYDNRDAVSGQPDEEVYLYDAAANGGEGRLVCASCDPSGARPHGVEKEELELVGSGGWALSDWLAASIPGWTPYSLGHALYQPRYLSDSGRLFFNSSDALLPQDSNGNEDVYELEPPGVGDCTESKPTFVAASGGCLGLISSGASAEESGFLDASESGDDVFFLTAAKLTPKDVGTSRDVYDARVGGGEPEPVKPVECAGDACQPPAVPPNDSTPGSLTFHGAGNLLECPRGKVKRSGKCIARKHKKHHKKHHNAKHRRAANTNRRASR